MLLCCSSAVVKGFAQSAINFHIFFAFSPLFPTPAVLLFALRSSSLVLNAVLAAHIGDTAPIASYSVLQLQKHIYVVLEYDRRRIFKVDVIDYVIVVAPPETINRKFIYCMFCSLL